MKKMAVGGTTTKRIIKKSTGDMYGIPQENLGTSGQYGFAKKGGSTGTHKMPNGKVMLNSKMKKGGIKLPKAQNGKNVVYQGPISEEGNYLISRAEDNKKRYPLSAPKKINDIAQSDRNPKNSKRIEKGKPYVKLSKDTGKAYRKDFKNLPKDSPEKKERRTNATIATVVEAVAAPFIGKFIAKNWNLPKKNGGVVKYKTGGATKAAKFAALAPPYDKATFADKIVGAKKNAGSKKLPKAQFGAFIKAFSKVVKPVAKVVKPASKVVKPVAKRVATTSKKNIPKKIDFRNTKNSMERMMGSKQIQNYFKKSTQRDQLLKLVNKNKN